MGQTSRFGFARCVMHLSPPTTSTRGRSRSITKAATFAEFPRSPTRVNAFEKPPMARRISRTPAIFQPHPADAALGAIAVGPAARCSVHTAPSQYRRPDPSGSGYQAAGACVIPQGRCRSPATYVERVIMEGVAGAELTPGGSRCPGARRAPLPGAPAPTPLAHRERQAKALRSWAREQCHCPSC